jgi:bleomycin hydrolase
MITRSWTAVAAALSLALPAAAQRERPQQHEFDLEVDLSRQPALSQGNAGTCWSFATVSFLEAEVGRIRGEMIDLSELYSVYFGYLEKARRYVRLHGLTQFGQGGLSHDVIHLVSRYGIVPQSDYTGLLGDATSHDHTELESVLKSVVETVAKQPRPSDKWEGVARAILSNYLGDVPASITVGGTSMTPAQFAHDELAFRAEDYRELMSLSSEPYWEKTQLLVPDNWMHYSGYWNVPLDTLLDNLEGALRAGYTVAIDLDMSEPTTRRGNPVWTLPQDLEVTGAITEELRQKMFDSRQTTDDHLMHIVGIAKNQEGRQFFLTKNSHGNGGPYDGHVYISRNYLAAKMLAFMVHKDALLRDTVERVGD